MSTDTTNTKITYDHTENKRLYCQDWIETDRPWERWECLYGGCSAWMSLVDHPDWSAATQYRRIDQHRKLQEIAKDPTKQIKVKGSDIWYDAGAWYWSELPENYEIRDKPASEAHVLTMARALEAEKQLAAKDAVIAKLEDALYAASRHLNYCGWGDSWERECADEQGIPEQVEQALAIRNDDSVLQEMLKQAKREEIK